MSTTSDLTSLPYTPEPLSDHLDSFNLEVEPFELPFDFVNQLPPNLFQLSSSPLPHCSIPVATQAKSRKEFEQSSDFSCGSSQMEQNSSGSQPESDPNKPITLRFTLPMEMLKYLKRREYFVVREIILLSGSSCELKLKTNHKDVEFLEFITSGLSNQVSKAIELLTNKIWKWKKT